LSSGGGKKGDKTSKVINLQNIKKDAQMKNICVADQEWRRAYRSIGQIIKKYGRAVAPRKVELFIKKYMPTLSMYLVLDYGQIEVRTLAQITGDKNLINDCQEADIHTTVGVAMTGWDADAIKNNEAVRTLTKNVHFGIIFGLSKKGVYEFVVAMSPLEMRDRISKEQVEEAYDRYFLRYPGVRKFIDAQRAFAKEHGYVETLFGMVQTLNVTDDNAEEDVNDFIDADEGGGAGKRGAYWGNQAINGPVQGSAHQVMICALVNLIRKKQKYAVLGIPPMEVHDALYFVHKVLDFKEAYEKAVYLLEHESLNTVAKWFPHIKWRVPIVVEAKAGLRLGCVIKVDSKTNIGEFMVQWYDKCKEQIKALDKQLAEAAA
jgi:DNA polymerase I-like protein with 3'-5' exonuclease and polymerase domains